MQLRVIIVLMIIYIEILIFTRLFKFYTTFAWSNSKKCGISAPRSTLYQPLKEGKNGFQTKISFTFSVCI